MLGKDLNMPSIQKTLRILEFIRRYQASNNQPPTIALIGRQFGMNSTASVHAHLKKLEAKGYIRREHYSRVIEIVEQTKAA